MCKKYLVMFIMIVSLISSLSADTIYFNKYGAMRKWEDPMNWNLERLPNDTDIAMVFRNYFFQDSQSSCLIDEDTGTAIVNTLRIGAGQGKAVINMTGGNLQVDKFQVAYTSEDPNCVFNMSGGTAVVGTWLWFPMNAPTGYVNLSGNAVLYLDGQLIICDPEINNGREGHMDISDQARLIVRYGEGTNNADPPYYLNTRAEDGFISGNGVDGNVNIVHDEIAQEFIVTACPLGDFTDDCYVDEADLMIMAEEWLGVNTGDPNTAPVSNIDGDDRVDYEDFSSFGKGWKVIIE